MPKARRDALQQKLSAVIEYQDVNDTEIRAGRQ
jgi:hypothetical protein